MSQQKQKRGFAAMSLADRTRIARKGGISVSRNRRHMARIGRRGGKIACVNRMDRHAVAGR